MLFPQPRQSEFFAEKFKMDDCYANCSLVDFFKKIKHGAHDIKINHNLLLGKEEYKLSVNADGVTIFASCDEGIYRAATSLWQLIKKQKGEISFCEIDDGPEIERRGLMLDISRGRIAKLDTIKTIIDFISALKYNEFQLYMEAGCFKYSSYPKYTEGFDCLTPADIEELDTYCSERFIDLVPNQNSFGHMAQWLVHDEFTHLSIHEEGKIGGSLNPLLPESFEFMDNVYSSLLPHFKSEYVNIGLDEVVALGKFQTEEYCRKYGKSTLFMEWLNKLNNLINEKYGKKIQFWADMIYDCPELYDCIPKDAVVLEWGYELIQSQRMTEHCIAFQNAGLNYYVCPSCNTHMSFTGRFDVTSFNIRTCAELAVRFGAKGMLITDWGSGRGHPHFGVWSIVPCALAGQYAWNTGPEQDGETFKADFIRASEDYVDDMVFGVKGVSRLMYRMCSYYLLEPERVHVSTMCGGLIEKPVSETKCDHIFDLKDSGDSFYFDNVIRYVKDVMTAIEKLDFDEQMKREILLNSKMVIMSAKICKIRIGDIPPNEEIDRIIALIDWICTEYDELWCRRNYKKGVEIFINQLNMRREELISLKK